jgi:RNA polymerase sigma factor (sigma-70 family)
VIGAASRSALRLQSDRRLVALSRAGSDSAFEAIVERYRAPLQRYCRRVLGPDQAEDVVQQTFMNAYRALHRDDRDIELRPWLYRIAHNTALTALARVPVETVELDDQFDGVAQPPEIAERHARIDALVAGIRDLPERQRIAIVRRELEGRSHEEIAREIDATAPVVRQLIYRARTRLRDVCGLLVPLPLVRALLSLQASGGMAGERTAEVAAGAGAGGVLVKVGATVLATGAIATGLGGTARDGRAPAAAKPQKATAPAIAPPAVVTPIAAPRTVATARPPRHHARAEDDQRGQDDHASGRDERSRDDDHGRDRHEGKDDGEREEPDTRAGEHDNAHGEDGESGESPEDPEVHEAGTGEEHGPEEPQPDEPQEPPAPEDEHSGA